MYPQPSTLCMDANACIQDSPVTILKCWAFYCKLSSVRGENLEAEKRERADKQAGNVINETEDSQNSASGRTESAATATT